MLPPLPIELDRGQVQRIASPVEEGAIPTTHRGRALEALRRVFTPTKVAVAAPIILLAVMGWHRRWVSDDGWINIRVVDQFFAGNGPVYNAGERVEVTTSTLWLWILLAVRALAPGAETQVVGAALGCALTVGGLVAASFGAAWLFPGHRTALFVPLGTLVIAALPPFWDFATSGLETGLSFAWLGGSFALLARRVRAVESGSPPSACWPAYPAFVIGLGPLIRPDFAVYAGLFGLALLLGSRRRWWEWILAIVTAAALPAAYQIWRMGYYGLLVPNTAIAKDAADANWEKGLAYLVDYAGLYALIAPVLVALLGIGLHLWNGWQRGSVARLAVVAAPMLGALIHMAYIVRIGGDFMHARMLLPATMALMLPVAVVGLRAAGREVALVATAFVTGWAVAVAGGARTPYAGDFNPQGIANERAFWTEDSPSGHALTRGDWMGAGESWRGLHAKWDQESGESYYDNGEVRLPAAGEGVYVAAYNLGYQAVIAGTDVMVIDKLALSDGITSHAVLDPRLHDDDRAGHQEKPDSWRVARYVPRQEDEPVRITHARAAMKCGDLPLLQEAITADMTSERFWTNFSLAPRLTFFSFPADPATARKELCGWSPGW